MAKGKIDRNDPNYRRRYDSWDGVGCGGCAFLIYMGPPLYYDNWGYNNYGYYNAETNVVVNNYNYESNWNADNGGIDA